VLPDGLVAWAVVAGAVDAGVCDRIVGVAGTGGGTSIRCEPGDGEPMDGADGTAGSAAVVEMSAGWSLAEFDGVRLTSGTEPTAADPAPDAPTDLIGCVPGASGEFPSPEG